MATCKLCSRKSVINEAGICPECTTEHALPERTEPLRPRTPCRRCNNMQFVRCHVLRERSATAGENGAEYFAPLAATFAHNIDRTFWGNRTVRTADPRQPVGVFEAYICRKCGHTEIYARDAAQIPIGPEYATELFDVATDAPYR